MLEALTLCMRRDFNAKFNPRQAGVENLKSRFVSHKIQIFPFLLVRNKFHHFQIFFFGFPLMGLGIFGIALFVYVNEHTTILPLFDQ